MCNGIPGQLFLAAIKCVQLTAKTQVQAAITSSTLPKIKKSKPYSHFLLTPYVAYIHVRHSTGTGAGKKHSQFMGYYKLLATKTNDSPAWKLESSSISSFLYRGTSGKWFISSKLGSTKKRIVSTSSAETPLSADLEWMYKVESWVVDHYLTVTAVNGEKFIN